MVDDHKRVHRFGGDWTTSKLNVLAGYLKSYTTALKDGAFLHRKVASTPLPQIGNASPRSDVGSNPDVKIPLGDPILRFVPEQAFPPFNILLLVQSSLSAVSTNNFRCGWRKWARFAFLRAKFWAKWRVLGDLAQ